MNVPDRLHKAPTFLDAEQGYGVFVVCTLKETLPVQLHEADHQYLPIMFLSKHMSNQGRGKVEVSQSTGARFELRD